MLQLPQVCLASLLAPYIPDLNPCRVPPKGKVSVTMQGPHIVRAAGCNSVQGKAQQLLTQRPVLTGIPHMLPFPLQPDAGLLAPRGHTEMSCLAPGPLMPVDV